MKTYDVSGAADFLQTSKDTIGDLAGCGALAGAKIGKNWVFTDEALESYLRDEVSRQTAERRGKKAEPGQRQDVRAKVQTARTRITRRRPMAPPSLSMEPLPHRLG